MRDAAYAATSLDESQQREEYIKKTAEEEIQVCLGVTVLSSSINRPSVNIM